MVMTVRSDFMVLLLRGVEADGGIRRGLVGGARRGVGILPALGDLVAVAGLEARERRADKELRGLLHGVERRRHEAVPHGPLDERDVLLRPDDRRGARGDD